MHAGATSWSPRSRAAWITRAAEESFVISPAPLTVAVADATKVYGQVCRALTGTITGIQNNDPITATYSSLAPASRPPEPLRH